MDASTAALAYAFASLLCVAVPLAAAALAAAALADTELKSLEETDAAHGETCGSFFPRRL